MSTLMAVFAHPDDETFICGGTLARASREGHRVILVCATKGEMGRRMGVPPVATRESIGSVREEELKNACQALGIAKLTLLGLRDKSLEIRPYESLVSQVLSELMAERPQAVVTFHEKYGGHPDHCTIGKATTDAFQRYRETEPGARLYYVAWSHMYDERDALLLSADQFVRVDVSKDSRAKLMAFRAHKTQSGMNDAIWRDEKSAASRLGGHEFFLQAHSPYQRGATGLFDS